MFIGSMNNYHLECMFSTAAECCVPVHAHIGGDVRCHAATLCCTFEPFTSNISVGPSSHAHSVSVLQHPRRFQAGPPSPDGGRRFFDGKRH